MIVARLLVVSVETFVIAAAAVEIDFETALVSTTVVTAATATEAKATGVGTAGGQNHGADRQDRNQVVRGSLHRSSPFRKGVRKTLENLGLPSSPTPSLTSNQTAVTDCPRISTIGRKKARFSTPFSGIALFHQSAAGRQPAAHR
jgi:hypothetical protein